MAKRVKKTKTKATKGRPPRVDARRWEADGRTRQLPAGDRDDDGPPGLEAREKDGGADDLGPIILPTPADAHRVLRELATLYHDRFDAQQRHDKLKSDLKAAAAEIDRLTTRIADRIRVATHRTGLPLFADADAELEARG